ncbi:MAG: DNA-3-methyladenine glycosylase [Saprospiraceae bacterium]|nr:DNA-3-methyladenine glycosylase [Saprospiraceae bacterium]
MHQLPLRFYTTMDVVSVARSLVGKLLLVEAEGEKIISRIVETEAYRGPDDRACHAFDFRYTERTKVMYEKGGCAYVYISYGMHHLLNVVTAPKDHAHAVLIRAIEPLTGLDTIRKNRSNVANNHVLTGGPGKICQALNIDKAWNGLKFYDPESPIQIWDDGFVYAEIKSTPRVGMSVHVGDASHWPWRFYATGNKYVSRPLEVKYPW